MVTLNHNNRDLFTFYLQLNTQLTTNSFLISGQWDFPELDIAEGPSSGYLQTEHSTILDCSWRAVRAPKVSWTKDGVPVDMTTGRFSQHSNGSLELHGVTSDMSGLYQCRVSLSDVGTVLSTPALIQAPG